MCPLCGSSFFSTISVLTETPWVRRCKGHWVPGGRYYTGCDYTWTSNYDHLHGVENNQDPQDSLDPLDPLDPSLWRVEVEEPPEFDLGGEG